MPDPWLTEDELKRHNEEAEKSEVAKQGEEIKKEREEAEKAVLDYQQEQRKKVEDGELVPRYANGSIVGYRKADDVPEEERALLGGIRPKAEGRGGATEGELGPVEGAAIPEGGASPATSEDPTGANRDSQPGGSVKEAPKKGAKADEKADDKK